jgi:hypothetical protein
MMKKKGYKKGGVTKKMVGGAMKKKPVAMKKGGASKKVGGGMMKKKGYAKGGVARLYLRKIKVLVNCLRVFATRWALKPRVVR